VKDTLMRSFLPSRLLPIAVSACLGVACVGAANAAPDPKAGTDNPASRLAGEYLELDSNGDGRITEVEVLQESEQKFNKIDVNRDGAITLEEVRGLFSQEVPPEVSERLRERGVDDLSILFIDSLDSNKDGKVQLVEFQRPARERFRVIDANSDGFVTPGETTVFFSRIRF
jgi:Ca2+-binding EF-hand superfamily protein